MYKKIVGIIIFILLIGTIFNITLETVRAPQDGDYTYTVSDEVAIITGYTGAGGTITIPSTLGGYPIVAIGSSAFYQCSSLTSVTIGNGITSIGSEAFYQCSSLTSVTIPDSATTIGDNAFQYCESLTSVSIPNSLTTIGNGAFSYCHSLTSLTIGSSVTTIGNNAFLRCNSLTSVSIPNSVTTIGNAAFRWCSSLASVTIGNSVTSIGYSAFYCCYSLTSVSIPNSVTTIEMETFMGCSSLTSVTIGSSVTTIGAVAFYSCSSLTSIIFLGLVAPNTVGSSWIGNTPSEIRGHAYASSNFPLPGCVWNGLTMGTVIDGNQPQQMTKPVEGTIIYSQNAFRGYYITKNYKKNDYHLNTLVFKPLLPQYPKGFHEYKGECEVVKKKIKITYKIYDVYHEGIDILRETGTPVYPAASGTIKYINVIPKEGPGKWIMIWHGDITKLDGTQDTKISSRYLHLNDISQYIKDKLIEAGKNPTNFAGWIDIPITSDKMIGTVGNTGCPNISPHLHFEVRRGDDLTYLPYNTLPLNPCEFIDYSGYTMPPENPKNWTIKTLCPVDLMVTDPDGLIISKEINQLSTTAQYIEIKNETNQEGPEEIPNDSIIIFEQKIGDYLINVIPEPETSPDEVYTLEIYINNQTILLAKNTQIGNILSYPYIIKITETDIFPIIPSTIDIDPDVLNLNNKGKWITCYIELPENYNVENVNISTILLNDLVTAEDYPTNIGDYDDDSIPDLMVKFNRSVVAQILHPGDNVQINITGELFNGTFFKGNDFIKVIIPCIKEKLILFIRRIIQHFPFMEKILNQIV